MIKSNQIGACGELYLQYWLLHKGIESARLTTDSGIDLVAYHPKQKSPITIQVKTKHSSKNGRGWDWWVSGNSPAQYIAFIALADDNAQKEKIWIFTLKELEKLHNSKFFPQKSNGKYHVCIYCDARNRKLKHPDFKKCEEYLLEKRIEEIFGINLKCITQDLI